MLTLLLACTPSPVLSADPPLVDLGTVDFAVEMPDEGYAPQPVVLLNQGKTSITVEVLDADPDHLCLPGFTTFEAPYELGQLAEGATYGFQVAACDHEPGERDTLVETAIRLGIVGDDEELVLPVQFTPTRTIDDGT